MAVTNAHTATGKPVAVTEVGWPTCGATGDSQNWSEQAEANNIWHFVDWARTQGTSVVNIVTPYNDVDESSSRCYGIWRRDLTAKPAVTALQKAAAGLPYNP
jgi:exo-beta-1,3-glucanase (GH17 family)